MRKSINLRPDMKLVPALCVDFDGTIRRSKSGKEFIKDANDIELIPGVEKKLEEYSKNGFIIFGITNQGGVAFGYKTPEETQHEIDTTLNLFKDGHPFHTVRAALSMPNSRVFPYNKRSLLRKPDIGMLALCEVDAFHTGHVVDWDNSIFVGDRQEDIECANNAKIRFIPANEFFAITNNEK